MSHHTVETVRLKAADGHSFGAALVRPTGRPRGAVVIVQEIFGVTPHIRAVAHQYADHGWLAIAPALFDRVQPDAELPYSDVEAGRALMQRLVPAQTLLDLSATIAAASAGLAGAAGGKVGMVGYCWGGTMTWLAACHLPLAAGVCYYGGGLPRLLDRTPKCPMMFHFGERDAHIPLADVEQVKKAYPLGHYYLYPADHGFNCTDRAQYDADSARLAFDRSLDFLHRHAG